MEAKFQGNMHAPCIKSELCVRILCREQYTASFVCNPEVRARLGCKLRSPLNMDNSQGIGLNDAASRRTIKYRRTPDTEL